MSRFILLLSLFLFSSYLYGQTQIKGILIDSTHHNYLNAATVSVFEKGDDKINKIGLTDRYGKFIVTDVPNDRPLILEFTFQGFHKVVKELHLVKNEIRDLGQINMTMKDMQIDTVDILPPVRMNGDTIEFNADAFKLDTNAVIQDLLHKLPGMVVWGDGKVTYNGRTIPNVLVNGKPFFGNDKSIVLQNIAKDAVEKLQVYDGRSKEQQKENPSDPNYEMNVVLKDGKEKMIFGNLTAAIATDKRYEGHLNTNYADRRRQATIALSTNNTNKNLNNLDQLLRNTTFKGIGLQNDFSPDFLSSGIVSQKVVGLRYQHDLIASNEINNKNIIIGNVLYNQSENLIRDSAITSLIIDNQEHANRRYQRQQSNNGLQTYQGNVQYEYKKTIKQRDININSNLTLEQRDIHKKTNSLLRYDYPENVSNNETIENAANNYSNLDFSTRILIGKKTRSMKPVSETKGYLTSLIAKTQFDIYLKLEKNQNKEISNIYSNYSNYLDTTLSRQTDRLYERNNNGTNYEVGLGMQIGKFKINQYLNNLRTDVNDLVYDQKDSSTIITDNLTHKSRLDRLVYTPSITYSHQLYGRHLVGRKEQSVDIDIKFGTRFFTVKNHSSLDFRNLYQYYITPLPEIQLTQFYSRPKRFIQRATLSYRYEENYPQLDQIKPFYDDINPSFRRFGTHQLKTAHKHVLAGRFAYEQQKKYGYIFSFTPTLELNIGAYTDSIVNAPSQLQYYIIQNTKTTQNANANFQLEKSLLLKKEQTLTVELDGNLNWRNNFQKLNEQEQEFWIRNHNVNVNIFYTYSNKLIIGWLNGWNGYKRTDRLSRVNNYNATSLSSGLSTTYSLTKKWTINSNATGRLTYSSFTDDRMLIWNANTVYRFSKGNNYEIKLAAYDLLKQNKGIYFVNSSTEVTTGYRNNLTQYFMFSMSYFPRKFGFKN